MLFPIYNMNQMELIRLGVLYCISNAERSGADYIDWGPINNDYLDEIALAIKDSARTRTIPSPKRESVLHELERFYDRIRLDDEGRIKMNNFIFDGRVM